MDRRFLGLGAAFGFIAVAAGAFGAHGLREILPSDRMEVFETAARYLLVHALALLAAGLWAARSAARTVAAAAWLFVSGSAIFSGTLFILSLTGIRWLGAITPIGGVALLGGWGCLLWAALFQMPPAGTKID